MRTWASLVRAALLRLSVVMAVTLGGAAFPDAAENCESEASVVRCATLSVAPSDQTQPAVSHAASKNGHDVVLTDVAVYVPAALGHFLANGHCAPRRC